MNAGARMTVPSISANRPLKVRLNRSAGAWPSPMPNVFIGATRLQATSMGSSKVDGLQRGELGAVELVVGLDLGLAGRGGRDQVVGLARQAEIFPGHHVGVR